VLLASTNPAERMMALKHPGVSEHHLWRALQDPNLNVFYTAMKHPDLRREHIDYVVKNRAREMPGELLDHPAFDNEMLEYMLQRPNDYHNVTTPLLASHPKLTRDQVEKTLAGAYPDLGIYATRAARSQGLTADDIRDLHRRFQNGEIPDIDTALGVTARTAADYLLENPNTPGDILQSVYESQHASKWGSWDANRRRILAAHPNTPVSVIDRVVTDPNLPSESIGAFAKNPQFTRAMHERALDNSWHPRWAEQLLNNSPHTTPDDLARAYLELPKRDAWTFDPGNGDAPRGGRYDWKHTLRDLADHPAHTDESRAAILRSSHLDPKVYDAFAEKASMSGPETLHAALLNKHPDVAEKAIEALRKNKEKMPEEFYRDFVAARGRPLGSDAAQALQVTDASPALLRDLWTKATTQSMHEQQGQLPSVFDTLYAVAGHPNVPPEIVTQAAAHGERNIRRAAVETGKLDEQSLRNIVINEFHDDVRNAALKAGGPKMALAGIQSQWPDTRHAAIEAYHHHFTPEMWSQVLTSHDGFLRANAVRHAPVLLPDQAHAAALDDSEFVRRNYAGRHDVLPEHFGLLAKDPDSNVRTAAVANPLLPDDVLRAVALDEKQHPNLRTYAQSRLGERIPDDVHKERVTVKLGTHKMRAVRDHILGLGLDEAHPKQLPPGDWKAGRTPQGLISAKKLQHYIDALPGTDFNVSHGKWDGAQRHNHEPSKVFRLALTNDMVRKLQAAGAYGSFVNTNREVGQYHEMPVTTVGWVRYTGTPKKGIHIDEIQSDFQNALADRLKGEAISSYGQHESGESVITAAYERGASIQNPQHHPTIRQILFGNKEPTEVLHEAFLQYLRDRGHHKAVVHMPSSEMTHQKLQDEGHIRKGRPIPAHMVHTYDSMPKKAGYQDAEYGEIPTQSNPKYKQLKDPDSGATTPAARTRKTKVMKSDVDDDDVSGPEEVVLVPDSEHFASLMRPAFRRKVE
jgi:hypothetical protein